MCKYVYLCTAIRSQYCTGMELYFSAMKKKKLSKYLWMQSMRNASGLLHCAYLQAWIQICLLLEIFYFSLRVVSRATYKWNNLRWLIFTFSCCKNSQAKKIILHLKNYVSFDFFTEARVNFIIKIAKIYSFIGGKVPTLVFFSSSLVRCKLGQKSLTSLH